MTLAIEPMVNMGTAAIRVLDDKWTVVTADGKPSAHFEHTVLITSGEPEVSLGGKKSPRRSKRPMTRLACVSSFPARQTAKMPCHAETETKFQLEPCSGLIFC
jgi:hypothetical protein